MACHGPPEFSLLLCLVSLPYCPWATCDDLSATDHTGSTPLHHAVRVTCGRGWTHKCGSECVQMVTALLKAGADTMRVDNKGRTALHYCCMVSEHVAC